MKETGVHGRRYVAMTKLSSFVASHLPSVGRLARSKLKLAAPLCLLTVASGIAERRKHR